MFLNIFRLIFIYRITLIFRYLHSITPNIISIIFDTPTPPDVKLAYRDFHSSSKIFFHFSQSYTVYDFPRELFSKIVCFMGGLLSFSCVLFLNLSLYNYLFYN